MNPLRLPLLLLASPSQPLAYLLQRYAEDCGCRIALAGCGESLAQTVLAEPPDLIFLDVSKDKRACRLALEGLASREAVRRIPVVLCATSELDWADLEADGRLLEPILFEQFAATLAEFGINISENKKEA